MKKDKTNIIILMIVAIIMFITVGVSQFSDNKAKLEEIVPLTDLPYSIHLIIVRMIWPILGSLLLIVIFPLVIAPIFLMLKKLIWSKYTNSYLELSNDSLSFKKVIKRTIYVFLLTYGIAALLANFIDMDVFLNDTDLGYWTGDLGIESQYATPALAALLCLIIPFAVAIWSVGWVIEDAGLMHYKLPKEGEQKLYEIEPVHLKYNSIVKGYAGISSIIFIIGAIVYLSEAYLNNSEVQIVTAFIPLIWGFGSVVLFFFAYIIYAKFVVPMMTKLLRKGKEPISIITKEQLQK